MRLCFSLHLDQRNEQGLFFSTFGLDQRHEERVFCSPASMRPVMELVPIGRRHFDLKSVQMGSWRCCKETEVGLKCGQRTWFADQNQPLISLGKNSGLSQPSKLHLWRSRFNLIQRHHLLSQQLAAGGPEELHAPIDETLDPVVLLLGLEGHKVHAALP